MFPYTEKYAESESDIQNNDLLNNIDQRCQNTFEYLQKMGKSEMFNIFKTLFCNIYELHNSNFVFVACFFINLGFGDFCIFSQTIGTPPYIHIHIRKILRKYKSSQVKSSRYIWPVSGKGTPASRALARSRGETRQWLPHWGPRCAAQLLEAAPSSNHQLSAMRSFSSICQISWFCATSIQEFLGYPTFAQKNAPKSDDHLLHGRPRLQRP